jgi:hypothetical protein
LWLFCIIVSVQFSADDIEFIVSVLGSKVQSADTVTQLLADEETRDLVLDDESLFKAVLDRPSCLRISTHFYFYLLVRQAFRRSGLHDRGVADYVAEVLSEFSRTEQTRCVLSPNQPPLDYFFEMMTALRQADDHTSFQLRAHIGNYSLYLSGVFPERIRVRTERRGAPDLSYYEALGQTNFRVARDHRLARKYELSEIFDTLSERFKDTRRALNDLTERLVTLGDIDVGTLLRNRD